MLRSARTSAPIHPRRTLAGSLALGIAVAGLTFAGLAIQPSAPAAAADDSSVTITAKDYDADFADSPFPDLSLTVSQTKDLVLQGLQLSWTGGKPSSAPNNQTGGENFLQVMQCWGDDPANPGHPDRTTCQYGAFLTPGTTRDSFRTEGTIADQDLPFTAPAQGFSSPAYTSIPFRSATGKTISSVVDQVQVPVDVNTNEFFTAQTSNELPWAGSGANGSGSAKFEVQTATQSPGLGCGTPITAADGSVTGQPCWLVIIPRGTADTGEPSISKSGLFYDSWKHHLAVRLDFKPTGVRCAIGAAERQVAGSELAALAFGSWQPQLCAGEGGSIFSLLTGPESDAAALANGTTPAPLALTSRPLQSGETDELRYAPVAIAGVSIAFAVDREPTAAAGVDPIYTARARLPFTSLKLTPRLVAKLLTSSYTDALPYSANRAHLGANPRTIAYDPDFLAINDAEWKAQALVAPSLADLLVPQGRSDAVNALWQYVLADADAAAFLDGDADPWGMKVNPYYSTDPKVNPSGVGAALPTDDVAKADPVEAVDPTNTVGPINLITWRPYVTDLDTSAYLTLRGDGQVLGGWDPTSQPPKYGKSIRALPGVQRVLGLTDTPSASRYQVYTAELLNPGGQYVAVSPESLAAGAAAMTASATQPQVYGFDFRSTAATGATTAYPLTLPVYAAVNPAMNDAALRLSYAKLIRYAVTDGQTPGTSIGELPDGYTPLPQGWRDQALAAAAAIETGSTQLPTNNYGSGTNNYGSNNGFNSDPVSSVGDPTATGDAAGPLVGVKTPDDPELTGAAAALPISLVAGLLGTLAVPLIGRFRRRIR